MRINELILDWNGTVMSDLERSWEVTNRLLSDVGAPLLTVAQFQSQFTLPMRRFFTDIQVPADRLDDVERRWNRTCASIRAPLAWGARELLRQCKAAGVEVGVVTGADPALVRADASYHGIDSLVSWIAGPSLDKGTTLASMVHSGRGVAFVGDTVHDIASARSAGLIAIGMVGGYTPLERIHEANPDLVVDDLLSLVPLLRAG
jgi:phosphoglycolate phosphatase